MNRIKSEKDRLSYKVHILLKAVQTSAPSTARFQTSTRRVPGFRKAKGFLEHLGGAEPVFGTKLPRLCSQPCPALPWGSRAALPRDIAWHQCRSSYRWVATPKVLTPRAIHTSRSQYWRFWCAFLFTSVYVFKNLQKEGPGQQKKIGKIIMGKKIILYK